MELGSKFNHLGEDDLFVVQLRDATAHGAGKLDQVVNIKAGTLADELVEIATPGTPANDYTDGSAGVVYPGRGLYYDVNSGQMDVKIDSDLSFIGTITTNDSILGGSSIEQWDDGTYTDVNGQIQSNTRRGNFYIVAVTGVTLDTTIWNLGNPSDSVTSLGDLVICVDDSVPGGTGRKTHEWNVIDNVTGGQAVLQIQTAASNADDMSTLLRSNYVEVITNTTTYTPQRPLIRIKKVTKLPNNSGGFVYHGGLVRSNHAEILEEFNLDVWQGGLIKDLTIRVDGVSEEALHLDTQQGVADGYPELILSANKATDTTCGVTRLATSIEAQSPWNGSIMPNGQEDKVAMTPKKTCDNYVPRAFHSLQNIASI